MPKPKNEVTIAEVDDDGFISILPEALANIQAERAKLIAQVAILQASSQQGGLNPDGSLNVMVTIPEDLVLAMEPWVELEGTSLLEVVKKYIPIAVEGYINGGG